MKAVPNMHVNRCPVCLGPFPPETVEQLSFVGKGATVALCVSCCHAIAVGVSDDGRVVEASEVPRDWFVEFFSADDRTKLHDDQERMHHERGHWG